VKTKAPDRPKGRSGSHDFTIDTRAEMIKNSINHDETHSALLSYDINIKNTRGKNVDKDSESSTSQELNILSELEEVVAECEENDSFGRASAIALFHGDLSLSVSVLQRYISFASNNTIRHSPSTSSSQHADNSNSDNNSNNNANENNNHNNNIGKRNINSQILSNENNNNNNNNNEMEENDNNEEISHHIPFHKNTVTAQDIEENTLFTQLISLTAMCIAGFSSPSPTLNTNPNSSISSGSSTGVRTVQPSLTSQQMMWVSMCGHVVNQLEAHTGREKTNNHSSCCYLAAALRFLLDTLHRSTSTSTSTSTLNSTSASSSKSTPTATSTSNSGKKETTTGTATTSNSTSTSSASASACVGAYDCIVNDERLALEDRVSFACTYLDDQQTLNWLRKVSDDCTRRGDLGGLVVTGLAGEGLNLLQEYLERHDDLQTVALLVGRNVIDTAAMDAAASTPMAPGASKHTSLDRSREWQWLWEYRNLLNRMQLFIGRASLDVQLGRRNRLIIRPNAAISTGTGGNRGTNPGVSNTFQGVNKLRQSQPSLGAGRGAGVVDRKSGSARVLYQLPPHSDLTHVFLRCNYCSSSLPVDPLQQQQAAFFRKQRPLINCCANCKKPLPRCYVCLLYMGLVNPTHGESRTHVHTYLHFNI
jgi:hypothetical protein